MFLYAKNSYQMWKGAFFNKQHKLVVSKVSKFLKLSISKFLKIGWKLASQ